MFKYDYNKIQGALKTNQPLHTTLWDISFTSKNGGSQLNIDGDPNNIAPVISYNFSRLKINTLSKTLSPLGIEFETLKMKDIINSVSLTFFEIGTMNIRKALKQVIDNIKMDTNYNSLSFSELDSKALEFELRRYKATGDIIDTKTFTVYPINEISEQGDQDFSLDTFSVDFLIVNLSELRRNNATQ
jgi:hypothetical protein